MKRKTGIIEDLDFVEYIQERFNDPTVKIVCLDCGYRWLYPTEFDTQDNLEGFDETPVRVRCPICGSHNVEEA